MNQAILDEAVMLAAIGYDIILVGADKNPGLAKGFDWTSYKWSAKSYESWLSKRDDLALAVRLGDYIDIEIDAEDTVEREKLKQEFLALFPQMYSTVSWESKRGRHWLFKLTDDQRKSLDGMDAPSKFKGSGFEFRIGPGQQSLIPTPSNDYRKWVFPPNEYGVNLLPDSIWNLLYSAVPVKVPRNTCQVKSQENLTTVENLPEREQKRPGDIFNSSVSWESILIPKGWTKISEGRWRRPGKSDGLSATTDYCSTDSRGVLFYCFSSAEEIEPIEPNKAYSKFELYALLYHDNNYSAAAAQAVRDGYSVEMSSDCSEFLEDDDANAVLSSIYTTENKPENLETPQEDLLNTSERPKLSPIAYSNPIGQYALDLYNNYSIEADPAGILFQAFEIFGCLLGRSVYMTTEDGELYTNGFLFVVGNKATGRKGTAWKHAKRLFKRDNLPNDMSTEEFGKMIYGRCDSGEGLIKAMIDTQTNGAEFSEDQPIKFLMQDSEAIALLNKSKIENATLQQNMMKAWDGTAINSSKSKERAYVRKPHLSFIGHAQPIPLKDAFTNNMDYSGFMSRFKFIFIERSRIHFDPPPMPESLVDEHHEGVEAALRWAVSGRQLKWSDEAYGLCKRFYESSPEIFREHRQAQKYAMMLATLRKSETISEKDLAAAFAIQSFITECYKFIFGDWGHLGEKNDDEQKIIDFVRDNPNATITDVSHKVFHRHKRHSEIKERLRELKHRGSIKAIAIKKGKNATIGFIVAEQ